jgi:hypothetical protein
MLEHSARTFKSVALNGVIGDLVLQFEPPAAHDAQHVNAIRDIATLEQAHLYLLAATAVGTLGRDGAIFLISLLCASVKVGGPSSLVAGIEGVEAIVVELVQYLPHSVSRGECHLSDLGDIHTQGGKQDHLRSPPGHDRARASSHDPRRRLPSSLLTSRTRIPSRIITSVANGLWEGRAPSALSTD